ncbi:hypothetical protein KGQ27_01450 [Patescibacteria group bacterium]|nr:hypothetical protein [Patescibacteria group bacterium]MDE1946493.1 hypothetical protein [Patescibacteria group bacterium]MDE2011262.1 hypothetical protein [Patescibacteria group bacterium]MDE2233345.1 hypothetical protein [Patescibacteria group bacterium]
MLYRKLLKPILFRFDPEFVHDRFINFGEFLGDHEITRAATNMIYGYNGRDIGKTVDGIKYRTPVLLAAGFDYNARLCGILPCVGFGGEEVGSVTARPCAGNPKPRLQRLPKSRSIVVNKGLKNDGVDVIIERLKAVHATAASASERATGVERSEAGCETFRCGGKGEAGFVVGISIARTNDEKSATVETGVEDYAYSFRRLNEENVGDYYTINISCPNAFGGEAFATPELLDKLLARLKQIPCNKPVYVKMPINLAWDQFKALLDIIDMYGLNGVVIGNLNKDYGSLDVGGEAPPEYQGGLSGKPCAKLSDELIRKTRQTYGKRFTIIGAGGVMSPEDAAAKFKAGADLLQLITGMIFGGPGLIKNILQKSDINML